MINPELDPLCAFRLRTTNVGGSSSNLLGCDIYVLYFRVLPIGRVSILTFRPSPDHEMSILTGWLIALSGP